MTGREWKREQELNRVAEMADEFICNFLDKYLDTSLIYDDIRCSRNKLLDLYPTLLELDEENELRISAFCAGMLFFIMHATDMGIRWITLLPPDQEDKNSE
jgi:hypothetical protein